MRLPGKRADEAATGKPGVENPGSADEATGRCAHETPAEEQRGRG